MILFADQSSLAIDGLYLACVLLTVLYEQCLCTHVHVVGRDHMHSHVQQSVWKPFHKHYVMVYVYTLFDSDGDTLGPVVNRT